MVKKKVEEKLPTAENLREQIKALKEHLAKKQSELKQKEKELIERDKIDLKNKNAQKGEAIESAFPNLSPEEILELIKAGMEAKKEQEGDENA